MPTGRTTSQATHIHPISIYHSSRGETGTLHYIYCMIPSFPFSLRLPVSTSHPGMNHSRFRVIQIGFIYLVIILPERDPLGSLAVDVCTLFARLDGNGKSFTMILYTVTVAVHMNRKSGVVAMRRRQFHCFTASQDDLKIITLIYDRTPSLRFSSHRLFATATCGVCV